MGGTAARLLVLAALGVGTAEAHPHPDDDEAPTPRPRPVGEGRRHHDWLTAGLVTASAGLVVGVAGVPAGLAFEEADVFEGVSPEQFTAPVACSLVFTGSIFTATSLAHETRTLRPYARVRTPLGWTGTSLLFLGSAGFGAGGALGWRANAPAAGVTALGIVLTSIEAARLARLTRDLPPDVRDRLYHRRRRVTVGVAPTLRPDGAGAAVVGVF